MKKLFAVLMCLVLLACTAFSFAEDAPDWMNDPNASNAVENVTDVTVYDSVDNAGVIVNTDRPDDPTRQELVTYSYTPLDAILIIDVSGSMDRADDNTGRTLLDYAKIAADSFTSALLSINPASRIGIVSFSDSAAQVTNLLGKNDTDRLSYSVGALQTIGRTNTGDGFRNASEMLRSQGMDGRRRMVIMLTDGQANEGSGDPIQYTIQQGRECASQGYVYTIGMIGGLSESEKAETRRALNANYETRYFELDFDQVADAGSQITMITSSIAYAASSAETVNDAGNIMTRDIYQVSVGPAYNIRITAPTGDYLSSFPEDTRYTAGFGTISQVDQNKHIALFDDNYEIDLRGTGNEKSSYSIRSIHGPDMQERVLLSDSGWSHESIGRHITLSGGGISVTESGYNCTDIYARDWYGNPVAGLQNAATAMLRENTQVLSAPYGNAAVIGKLLASDRIWVLTESDDRQFYFISYTDDPGNVCRGWIPESVLNGTPDGFVPMLSWLSADYQTVAGTDARFAPDQTASVAFRIAENSPVRVLHCERSADGEIWAYVSEANGNNLRYGYIPASAIAGFGIDVPADFQLGHNINQSTETLHFAPISIAGGQKLKVFSAPSEASWRGAKGKAAVATNGEVRAIGWVSNRWLLIQYDTNNGNCRVGYVASAEMKPQVQQLPLIPLRAVPAEIVNACALTDDPFNGSETIVNLAPGTAVTYLSSYYDSYSLGSLAYIETTVKGQRVRGFVPAYCVEQK